MTAGLLRAISAVRLNPAAAQLSWVVFKVSLWSWRCTCCPRLSGQTDLLRYRLTSIGGNDLAMAKALELLFGSGAETVLVVAAIFILLAHQNLNYMMTSRVIYALSQDGLGSQKATIVADNGAPIGGVILSWVLVCVLIAIGSFEFLLNLTVSLLLIAYVALVLGVFRLRRSEPNTERPFVAWGYPYTGVICAVGWTAVAILISLGSLSSTLFGLAAIIVAIPVFLMLRKWRHLDGQPVA